METKRPARAAAVALVAAVTAALLELRAGRSLLCRCGHVRFWAGDVRGPENSQQIADWYSLSHIVHGLLFYLATRLALPRLAVAWRLAIAVVVEAAWEVVENSAVVIGRYRAATIAQGYAGDSVINSMADIGWMAIGFLFASRAPTWGSVAFGIALELIALAAIRDNLTLNVLMLVHPVAAVRIWQGG